MIIENSYVETVTGKYAEGYALEEYKTDIGIVVAREWEGKIYPVWAYKQMGRKGEEKPADKSRPMKVFLGDRRQAIKRLLEMAVLLGWNPKAGTIMPGPSSNQAADGQPEPPEGDIPF